MIGDCIGNLGYNGNLKLVKLLFDDSNLVKKPELESIDSHGNKYGATHRACLSGNIDLVKYLVEDRKITIENNAWIFFYCRNVSVFEYFINYFEINKQSEEFIVKLKKTLINYPNYDYEVFREILNIKILSFKKEDYNEWLYKVVIFSKYNNQKERDNKNKIIKKLILLGGNLYSERNQIFIDLMSGLTQLENNTKYSREYVNNKIQGIKEVLNHLDKDYNYTKSEEIKEIINYFKNNIELLNNEWAQLNNSYIKDLMI